MIDLYRADTFCIKENGVLTATSLQLFSETALKIFFNSGCYFTQIMEERSLELLVSGACVVHSNIICSVFFHGTLCCLFYPQNPLFMSLKRQWVPFTWFSLALSDIAKWTLGLNYVGIYIYAFFFRFRGGVNQQCMMYL